MKLGYCAWFFQWQSKCNLCIMLLNAFSGWSQNQLQWQEITRYVSSTLDPIFQTLFACIDKCTTHALIFKGIICITNWQRQHRSKGHHWSTTPTSNNYVHNSWDLTGLYLQCRWIFTTTGKEVKTLSRMNPNKFQFFFFGKQWTKTVAFKCLQPQNAW